MMDFGFSISRSSTVNLDSVALENFTKLQVNGGEVLVPNGVTVDNLTVREELSDGETIDNYYYGDYNIAMLLFTGHGPGPSGVVWRGQVYAEYGRKCIQARYGQDAGRLLPASVLPPFLLMCWLSV